MIELTNLKGPGWEKVVAELSAAAFASESAPYSIVVRFRGFDNGGSDKVPGVLVPAPGAAGMLAAAGLAMGTRRRRRD